MSINKKNEENGGLKITLLTALNKMNTTSTIKVCHDTIKKLITNDEKNENKTNYILNTISEHISSLQRSEKKESIKLLSTVGSAFKDISSYLSRLLTILQSIITEENFSNFTIITATFGEIVDITTNKPGGEGKIKTNYELLQGFCIYNMKLDKKANQICGGLCLTSLIENSAMVLEPAYLKYIWENIVYFIDKNIFNAKSELINSLISLIFASENLFKPFATVTLYKILDFLTDADWLKRKLALNVVYTLVIYSQEEILPLKAHIIEFLKVLKCDKVKEVREVCMQTLKLLNTTEEDEERILSDDDVNEHSYREINFQKENEKNEKSPRNKIKTSTKDVEISPKFKNSKKKIENEISKIEKKSVNNSRIDFDNSNLNELIIANDSLFEKKNENKNNGKFSKQNKKAVSNKNIVVQSKSELTSINKNSNENDLKTEKTFPNKNNRDKSKEKLSTSNSNNKKEINVNRKSDNSFVNTKMAIKRNPNHSIFNTKANGDFFSKSKNPDGDIEILFKEENKETLSKRQNQEVAIQDVEKQFQKEKSIPKIENIENNKKTNRPYIESEEINLPIYSTYDNDCIPITENNFDTKNSEFISNKINKMNLQNTPEEFTKGIDKHDSKVHEVSSIVKSQINKKETPFVSNNITNKKLELTDVLKQMKIISQKQIFLVDTIEKTQENTTSQFEMMNKRVIYLENTVEQLLSYIKANSIQPLVMRTNNTNTNGFSTKRYDSNTNKDIESILDESLVENSLPKVNTYIKPKSKNENSYQSTKNNKLADILAELKNNKPNEAFNIALNCNDEKNLIKLIEKINFLQIKEIDLSLLEDAVIRLVSLLLRAENTTAIISFLKNVVVSANISLKETLIQNINDILVHIPNNKQKFKLLNEEMDDINLILNHINSENSNNILGFSSMLQSFANQN